MGHSPLFQKKSNIIVYLFLAVLLCGSINNRSFAQPGKAGLQYSVSMPQPSSHYFHVELNAR